MTRFRKKNKEFIYVNRIRVHDCFTPICVYDLLCRIFVLKISLLQLSPAYGITLHNLLEKNYSFHINLVNL